VDHERDVAADAEHLEQLVDEVAVARERVAWGPRS
jgi:hypothetical protein